VANPNKLRPILATDEEQQERCKDFGRPAQDQQPPMAHMRDEGTREKLVLVNDRVAYGLRRGELGGTIRWLLKRRGIEVDAPFS